MTSHLRWSLHVLYLLLFWPSRYKADIGLQVDISLKSRLRHMTRMVPALMFLALVGSCVLALTIHCINGAPIFWPGILPGVVAGVLVGAACFLLVSDTVMATTMALSMGLLWGITGLEYLGLPRTLVVQATGLSGALWLSCSTGIVIAITSSLGRPPLPALWIRLFLALIGTAFFALFGLGVAMNAGLSKAVCALSSSMSFLVSFIVVHFRLFDYPIYALQSWSLAKASSQPNADVSRLWKKHPLAWNEVIWLPLPGVVTFLANLVKSDRDFGYEIISFVSAHRRHQARAVSAALSEVMLQDLQVTAFNQFPEVLRRLEWLRTPPKRLPQIAVQHGPAFVRIAEHAAHRLALTSREQQLQSLDRGATEIEQLQRSTMGTPDVLASRLLQCAMDWQSLFRDELRRTRDNVPDLGHIPDLFKAGSYLKEEDAQSFFGREDEWHQLENFMLAPAAASAILLRGARRMGKSSLLLQLPRLLGPDCTACYLDMQNAACNENLPRFFTALSEAITTALLRRGVTVQGLLIAQLRDEPFATFNEWLDSTEKAMRPGLRICICIDEYERMSRLAKQDPDWRLLDYLRHLQQQHRSLVLIYCGMRPFHALGPEWASRFVGARTLKLGCLDRQSSIRLLTSPQPDFPLRYAPGALNHLLEITGCQPFLLQAVAGELVRQLNKEKRMTATVVDVDNAVALAFEAWSDYRIDLWNDAGSDGQALVVRLLAGQPATPGPALARLCDYDLLSSEGKFKVPILEHWLRRALEAGEISLDLELHANPP